MASPPLTGVRVVELEGIGPAPLGCCILADFGADVVSVTRVVKGMSTQLSDCSVYARILACSTAMGETKLALYGSVRACIRCG